MPVRTKVREEGAAPQSKYEVIDLSFLPQEMIDRIDQIFDAYYNLGMKPSGAQIEGEYSPTFPDKVSSLDSPGLGDIHGEFTAWFAYVSDKLKYVAVATNHVETEMERVLNRELGQLVEAKGNIDAKKARAKTTPEYILMLSYLQRIRGVKDMLTMELASYDRSISSLSREISRREKTGGF